MFLNISPLFRIAILTAFFFSPIFGAGGRCGTLQFAERAQKRTLAKSALCPANNLGETVHSRTTQRFIIYYTTEGVHAATTVFIDSLAKYLEDAYDLHKNVLGMKGIYGTTQTQHYNQRPPLGFYPVEVIDTGLLRGEEGEDATFGLTIIPNKNSPKLTQIAIENDFLSGADCSGNPSTEPFRRYDGLNYSAANNWHLALKATVYHELYHSFQIPYLNSHDLSSHKFWLEASATGVEEISAPEVNDYIGYLFNSRIFNNPGKSMESLSSSEWYAYSVLYLFLYHELGELFDSAIWSYFSKYPKENFPMQLARLADSLSRNPEELFHKYASRIFFSGSRARFSEQLFSEDMQNWPSWRIKTTTVPSVFPVGAIDFIRTANGEEPNTEGAMISLLNYGDSTVWVLSRLLEEEFTPPPPPPKKFIAYNNPWNPKNPLRFGPLPENSKGVEIRSANGILLKRLEGKPGEELIWQPENLPKSGILFYRPFPYGEGNKLIVAH